MRFWNFKNEKDDSVDLFIEGTLTDDDNEWLTWWDEYLEKRGKRTPQSFSKELNKYKGKTVNVWINSYGGDVFAGVGLYDILMEYRKNGGHVVTKGEKVYSAATMPFLAGEKREMAAGGILMIHNPLTAIYGYAKDLRKAADTLDKIKNNIVNIYTEATGINKDRLSKLMDAETEMTPEEAVKEGMATGIISYALNKAEPMSIKAVMDAENTARSALMNYLTKENVHGGGKMDNIKTWDDLKKAFPEITKGVEDSEKKQIQDAVNAERKRIEDLDKLDNGNEIVKKFISNAKASGKTAKDIQFYVDSVKESTKVEPEKNFVQKAVEDFKDSNAAGVAATPAAEDKKQAENDIINKALGI